MASMAPEHTKTPSWALSTPSLAKTWVGNTSWKFLPILLLPLLTKMHLCVTNLAHENFPCQNLITTCIPQFVALFRTIRRHKCLFQRRLWSCGAIWSWTDLTLCTSGMVVGFNRARSYGNANFLRSWLWWFPRALVLCYGHVVYSKNKG